MVYKIIWTDPAIDDLKEVADYISEEDPVAAERLVLGLIDHAEKLEQFPRRGKVYQHRNRENVHDLPYRGYRIFYAVLDENNTVEILHIWHGAKDEPKL
ncbi:MAG: type II toxin-antitoxin system RelE/ParE family toxin [Puniceicoccaceae bacterium]